VAIAEVRCGPSAVLVTTSAAHHHLFHAIRADLLRRKGVAEAVTALRRGNLATENAANVVFEHGGAGGRAIAK